MNPPFHLGCPVWGNKTWVGNLFTRDAKARDFLEQYAQVFNAVEGNTTFYGLPSAHTVARWREVTPSDFRFCFKFPKTISHEKRLLHADEALRIFLQTMAPLEERLGPFFLQCPPSFDDLDALEAFLAKLSDDFDYAVEVRHHALYDRAARETRLHDMLRRYRVDLVIFDSRQLHALETNDRDLRDAQRRKPKAPVRFLATGEHPFLRYVGHPDIEPDLPILEDWAVRVAQWVQQGKTPHVFMHQAPDDVRAPELARRFQQMVRNHIPHLSEPAPWPGESEPELPIQGSLF